MRFINAFRIKELLPKLGFIYIGSVFALPDTEQPLSDITLIKTIILGLIAFSGGLSIYAYNAYIDYYNDQKNQRLEHLSSISRSSFLYVTILAATITLVAIMIYNEAFVFFTLVIFSGWWLYNNSLFSLKSVPFAGILIVLILQVVQFLFGYAFFQTVDQKSVLISVYFGLLVGAGHLWHEMIDLKPDKEGGVKTTAVYLGMKWATILFHFILLSAHLYLFIIWEIGFIQNTTFYLLISAYIIVLMVYLAGKKKLSLFQFRRAYLVAYLCAILSISYFLLVDPV